MSMKGHILMAMQEELENWDEKLSLLKEDQISKALNGSEWTIKDVLVHLWAWQQRTLARALAAAEDREPIMPDWVSGMDFSQMDVDAINARVCESYRDKPWEDVYADWKSGFQNLIEAAARTNERDLLDLDRFPFFNGYSLSTYLLSSYDHHLEHQEMLAEALETS